LAKKETLSRLTVVFVAGTVLVMAIGVFAVSDDANYIPAYAEKVYEVSSPLPTTLSQQQNNASVGSGEIAWSDSKKATLKIPKTIAEEIHVSIESDKKKMYSFSYSGEYAEFSGERDGLYVNVSNKQINFGATEFTAFNITEDEQFFTIEAVSPREKYQKIVMIDPGHGGQDDGADELGGYGKHIEKNIVLPIGVRVCEILSEKTDETGIKPYMTRYDDETVDKYDRAEISNEYADLFVSIHCNTYESSEGRGTEVHYAANTTPSGRLSLTNKKWAEILERNIVAALGTKDRGLVNGNALVVLNKAEVPAALVELVYLTNPSDLQIILSQEEQENAAQAIAAAVIEAFAQP
jgi:N-acetylmuramoyl-L-alanine amidase